MVAFFNKRNTRIILLIIFLLGLALRIYFALTANGHGDMGYWAYWARRINEVGSRNFYAPDVFTDYPPGYVGILWFIGLLEKLFNTTQSYPFDNLLLKLPAITFDCLTAAFLVKISLQKLDSWKAILLGFAYLFAPAVLINSSIWGQVDAVFTFFLVLVIYYLMQGKTEYTYIPFMVGVLIKPQMLMFAPVLLLGMIEHVFIHDFSWKKFNRNLLFGLSSLAGSFIYLSLFNIKTVVDQYVTTMSSYPLASVNAFNFWAFMKRNYGTQDELIFHIPIVYWGYIAICGAFILMLCIWFYQIRKQEENNYFLLASIFLFTIFTFSVRMHERYLFPIVILLLFAYLYSRRNALLVFYLIISLLHYLNVASIYHRPYYYEYNPLSKSMRLISLATVLIYIIFVFYTLHYFFKQRHNKI